MRQENARRIAAAPDVVTTYSSNATTAFTSTASERRR